MDAITGKSIGLDGEASVERRVMPRRRVLKGGTLSFNRGYGALECVVRNESAGGALLSFGDASAVPAAFDLTIKGAEARRAQVRWRGMTLVGVAFA